MSYSSERLKKISVTPVKREGGWLKGAHDGAFMFTGAHNGYTVPLKENGGGVLVDPLEDLTKEEREKLAFELGEEAQRLNINSSENIFFNTRKSRVVLEKGVKVLDLSKPWDFMYYRILKTNKDFVAPSEKAKFDKPTYRWALVDNEEVVQEKAKTSATKMEAIIKLSDYRGSIDKLTNLLTVSGMVVPKNATADWLFGEAYKLADTNPTKFLALATDEDFDIKLLINKAIEKKVIVKVGKEWGIEGGKTIGSKEDLVSYFISPDNTKELAFIKAKI
jgi:hypothetical protein